MTRARRLRLVTDNMPLARKVAKQVARKFAAHLSIEDFEQAGYLGLCEAARRCKRVSSFQAFAYFRVRGAIVDAHRRKQYREELNPSLEGMAAAEGARRASSDGPKSGKVSVASIRGGEFIRDTGPLPDELAARREKNRFLAAAIAALPEDERYVIAQSLSGVRVAAIAESRQRSATWTRAKLSSARGKVTAAVAGLAA
jgi:RNA polymerase sigma factor (sigma-70 family)